MTNTFLSEFEAPSRDQARDLRKGADAGETGFSVLEKPDVDLSGRHFQQVAFTFLSIESADVHHQDAILKDPKDHQSLWLNVFDDALYQGDVSATLDKPFAAMAITHFNPRGEVDFQVAMATCRRRFLSTDNTEEPMAASLEGP